MANLNMTEMSDEIFFQSKNSDPGKIKATSEKFPNLLLDGEGEENLIE